LGVFTIQFKFFVVVTRGTMKKLQLLVSLPNENSYHLEQAKVAKETAIQLGIDVHVVFADNDAITQSHQVLETIQSRSVPHPDAILFEPLTASALPRVGEAAVAAGIGWIVLNCDVEYLGALRSRPQALAFAVTRDHTEIGRIQGRQFAALLPGGGTVLYIQGPATSLAAVQRTIGMEGTRPQNVRTKTLRSPWTEPGAYEAVNGWLRLSTSRAESIDLIGCQLDEIAMGARKAFADYPDPDQRNRWLALPFTGVDGLPQEGQAWVDQGVLAATVVSGTTTRTAIEMTVNALNSGTQPPERTVIGSKSYPALERLSVLGFQRRQK
jgi:ribose transport system substrate-binding protein